MLSWKNWKWAKILITRHFITVSFDLSGQELNSDSFMLQVAFLTFVNTMIVQGKSIKERVKVREDFMVERITDILAVRISGYDKRFHAFHTPFPHAGTQISVRGRRGSARAVYSFRRGVRK